jgi:hypothetical protein
MSVVKFTDQPLYPKEKASKKSLGGPHSPPGHGEEQKNLFALVGIRPPNHLAGSMCLNH